MSPEYWIKKNANDQALKGEQKDSKQLKRHGFHAFNTPVRRLCSKMPCESTI